MKTKIIPLFLCLFLCFGLCAPALADTMQTGTLTDEEYLQQRALELAKANAASENVTVTGPHEMYGLKYPQSAWEAYARPLPTVSPKEISDTYALFFVYEDDVPSFVLMLDYDTGLGLGWRGSLRYYPPELKSLLAEKEALEKQFPNKEISYLLLNGTLVLFTPKTNNGYILLPDNIGAGFSYGSFDNNETHLIRTRDFSVGLYEFFKGLEDSGVTLDEWWDENPGTDLFAMLFFDKTYPVWPFWLTRVGIPAAVVVIAAAAAVFIIRKRKKAKEK